jgi:hypothetical protein
LTTAFLISPRFQQDGGGSVCASSSFGVDLMYIKIKSRPNDEVDKQLTVKVTYPQSGFF